MDKDPMLQSLFSTSIWNEPGIMTNTSNSYNACAPDIMLNKKYHNSCALELNLNKKFHNSCAPELTLNKKYHKSCVPKLMLYTNSHHLCAFGFIPNTL